MNLAADLGGIFIVLDVTALAFAHMRHTGPWKTDWIVISSEEATGMARFISLDHSLKTFAQDEVVKRFRLTLDQYPD